MTLRDIWTEAWRNFKSGVAPALGWSFALAVVLVALVWTDVKAVGDLANEARHFRASGGSTLVVQAQGQIDGPACDALARTTGVRAAGAIRLVPSGLDLAALPSAPLALYESTPGFSAVIGSGSSTAGVDMSERLSDALGVNSGDHLQLSGGTRVRVADTFTYPDDGRLSTLGFAVVSPVAPLAPFDQCWFEIWPTTDSGREISRLAVAIGAPVDTEIKVVQLNSSLGAMYDGPALMASRATSFAPWVAGVVGLALGCFSVFWRRLEFASALHAGVARRDLVLVVTFESLLWCVATLALSSPFVAVVVVTSGGSTDTLPMLGLAMGILAIALSALTLARVGTTLLIRESSLVRYFRERR